MIAKELIIILFGYIFQFEDNGNEVEMPEGYPLSGDVSSDDESIMTLRFKGKKIFYDPTVETGEDIGDVDDNSSNAGMSISSNMALVTSMAFILSFLKSQF